MGTTVIGQESDMEETATGIEKDSLLCIEDHPEDLFFLSHLDTTFQVFN